MSNLQLGTISQEIREAIEPACESFERAWNEGGCPVIEEQFESVPEAARPLLAAELLRIELEQRCRRGERPTLEEYRSRFPGLAGALDGWLDEARAAAGQAVDRMPPATPSTGWVPTLGFDVIPPARPARAPRVLGEYELEGELGGGGMGVVFRACHRRLGKRVALKLLPVHTRRSADAVSRFLREMKAVGGLKHPNVIEAHDAGEVDGVVYLAMELVEGTDLDRLVRERGPLPVAEACDLARQAALGLDYLHRHGLVHRDVKPSNLMRTADGTVKVLDLGLARWRQEAVAGGLTREGQGMGTPDYLAPEQAEDAAGADGRADLYGLGGTLYFLLTARAPFEHRRGLDDKLEAHRGEEAADLRTLRPEVPAALADLVRRLLAKDAEDRPRTAAEVAVALGNLLPRGREEGISRHRTADEVAARDGLTSTPRCPAGPETTIRLPGRTRRWPWWLAAGLLLAALGGLGALAWPRRPAAPPFTARLRVFRLSADGGPNARQLGELGASPGGSYRTTFNERVRLEAELSEPAHTYLLGFNPTDQVENQQQLIPSAGADQPPGKEDQLTPSVWLRLSDGVGLQAFALVASRQPLPPYSEWVKTRPPLPWKHTRALSGVVWVSDGVTVRALNATGTDRAPEENEVGDRALILDLARALKAAPGVEVVSVVGFAVDH